MATTYTTNLNLPKPSDGDYDWLTPHNQAMDLLDSYVNQLLNERAVSGTATGGSATTLVDSGQSWGVDAFVDAIVIIQRNGTLLRAERVTSNTADTLTFASGSAVQSGDAYSIFPQSALQSLTNVLANGAQGNIPAGQQFALRDSAGTTTYFSVDEATGAVTLGVDPAAPLNAVTKQYADNNFLALAGGQMAGLFRNRVVASVASAQTVDLSAATGANANQVTALTGTTPIETITLDAGAPVFVFADAAVPLKHQAAGGNIWIEGQADYTCAAGDMLLLLSDGTTTYVFIKKADGTAVKATTTHYSELYVTSPANIVEFTGLTNATEIEMAVGYNGTSGNTSTPGWQLGNSGGYPTGIYSGASTFLTTGAGTAGNTNYAYINAGWSNISFSGILKAKRSANGYWILDFTLGRTDGAQTLVGGYRVPISNVDRIRFGGLGNGTDTCTGVFSVTWRE